jgi:hypothetical protein
MKKTVRTIAMMAVFSMMTVGCQKENINNTIK